MSDDADHAQALEDRLREARIAALRAMPATRRMPGGACLNCEAPLPAGNRWCDADCRDDWVLRRDPGSRGTECDE